jgi:septal ring factor EnvC (AmiA/AmiB activator)
MSQDLHTPLSSRLRQPLDSVDNDLLRQSSPCKPSVDLLKLTKLTSRPLSQSKAELYEDCDDCKANVQQIESLQTALFEVIEQNEALKARVVELEAALNAANDEIEDLLQTKSTVVKKRRKRAECTEF